MSDETERAGLGKVIYSVNEKDGTEASREDPRDRAEVEEAVEESFPASDPPSFATGTDCETT
jgi:hypothetical protein